MARNQRSQTGMTLVEVICSLAILGILIAPTAAFFANALNTDNLAREQLEANQLAQKYMEEYKSKSFSDLIMEDPVTHFYTPITIPATQDDFGSDNIDRFTTNVVLAGTPAAAAANYHAIINIPSKYAGNPPLQLFADDSGVTVEDNNGSPVDSYPFTSTNPITNPITVMLKQDVGTSDIVTIALKNNTMITPTTAYTFQVTKLTKDDKLVLKPEYGQIVIINKDSEETPEDLYQENGITITVKVTCQSDKRFVGANLSQIKMTN